MQYVIYRYLARAVLVPFAYQALPVTIDTLDKLVRNAASALPQAIHIGHSLVDSCDNDRVYQAVSRIERILGNSSIDGRLAMQYALSLVCAEEVGVFKECTVCRYVTGSCFCF